MGEIQRYKASGYSVSMRPSQDGDYVHYPDHAARVADLEVAVERLQAALYRWLPNVREDEQAADDAALLIGLTGEQGIEERGEALYQRAERAEAEIAKRDAALHESEPPLLPDADLIALLPKWAGSWITSLKQSLSAAQNQAMENGQAARSAEAEARGLREEYRTLIDLLRTGKDGKKYDYVTSNSGSSVNVAAALKDAP